jgi:hypothetical protein
MEVRRRQIRHQLSNLPFPVKLAAANSLVMPVLLLVSPPPIQMRPAYLPIIWMGSYCVALVIAALMPRRKRPRQFHWIRQSIDASPEIPRPMRGQS